MKFLGCPYPIVKNPRGLLRTQNGMSQVKSDLLVLLLTQPGERVFLPDFGTPLRDLLFEPNDSEVEERARSMIIQSISTWEPRITVDNIFINYNIEDDLSSEDDRTESEHVLGITIRFFDPENINEVQELRLEVPLAGG